jgi:hypothetical protein
MSSFNFIIPGNFSVTQNANLYIMDIPATIETRRYHWIIDCGTSLNAMFSNRNYTQVSGNNEAYTANLTVDMTQVNTWLTTTGLTWDSTSNGGVATSVGLESGAQNFNLRLLEMAALEIFGHAKARAAISNESMFTNYHSHVTNHLSTTFNNQNIRNIFFEQYVEINRYYGSNDNQLQVPFNLANTSFYVFGNLNGEIVDATTSTLGTPGSPGFFLKSNYCAPMRIQFKS